MTDTPLAGKTYSLNPAGTGSDAYYEQVCNVADACLEHCGDLAELLSVVRTISRNKRTLRNIAKSSADHTLEPFLVHILRDKFSRFTCAVEEHLAGLPLAKRWDRTLAASEEQYHVYMLEIELQNRLDVRSFRQCETKLAFLPHCLRDLAADCRSTRRGVDYVCKGCSTECNVNAVSKLLRRHGVTPYIWRTANLRLLFRKLQKKGAWPGVLGIACVPELVSGMRICSRAAVPVVGVPLDANRCARWWGEFHYNTVNFNELERLLGEETRKRPWSRKTPGRGERRPERVN